MEVPSGFLCCSLHIAEAKNNIEYLVKNCVPSRAFISHLEAILDSLTPHNAATSCSTREPSKKKSKIGTRPKVNLLYQLSTSACIPGPIDVLSAGYDQWGRALVCVC